METPELFKGQTSPLYWANLTAKEDVIVNQGGSWSGKSYSIIQVLFTFAIMQPRYVITVISNTVTKIKEDALRIAQSIISAEPLLNGFIKSYNSTDRVYVFNNGSIIEFKSFEDQEQAKGGKRHILYVNEASRIKYMVFFEAQLRTSVRTFVDYNPTSQFWVHDKVIKNPLEYVSTKVIRSWHIHNPFLTQKQRDRLESIQDKELWKVYARGLTGRLKGIIYPDWVEVENFDYSDGIIWYIDFGYTNDPTASGRIAVKPKDRTDLDFIADEISYSPGIPMGVLVQKFKENGYKDGQLCFCDHDPTLIRELRMLGVAAFPALKGPDSIISRILFMRSRRIGYTKRSENIRMERSKYNFLEIDDHITNTPIDEYNHHMDGIGYGCQTYVLRTGDL